MVNRYSKKQWLLYCYYRLFVSSKGYLQVLSSSPPQSAVNQSRSKTTTIDTTPCALLNGVVAVIHK